MPKASAPKAPWVAVWLSPQTTVMPGWVAPSSGPMTCTMPCAASPSGCSSTPKARQFSESRRTCASACASPKTHAPSWPRGVVGVEWSMVARVRSGQRSRSPRSARSANACGLVTSCTRCRST